MAVKRRHEKPAFGNRNFRSSHVTQRIKSAPSLHTLPVATLFLLSFPHCILKPSPIIPLFKPRQVFQGLRNLVVSASSATSTRSASHASIPKALQMERPINVLGTPLAKVSCVCRSFHPLVLYSHLSSSQCGTDPITGFYRDGYCNTSPADAGSHTVAAIVSDSWLSFSASRGNDLRPILKGGCKWCLCAARWKESLDAWKRGEIEESVVPK